MRYKRNIPFFLLAIWLLLVTGCLSLENRLNLKQDGSGTIEIIYKLAAEILSLSEEEMSLIPLPLQENDFRRVLLNSRGLVLKDYTQSLDGDQVIIRAVLSFESLEQLKQLWGEEAQYLTLHRQPAGSKLEMTIPAATLELSEDSRRMMAEFFSTEYFSYRITVPGQITSFNKGRLVNKNTFYYQISIYDIFKIRDRKNIILTW